MKAIIATAPYAPMVRAIASACRKENACSRITAIATGFKMGMLDQITDANLGNIIWIDDSFKYEKKISSEDGIELPEIKSEKIGYNNAAVRKKNLFSDGVKPVLVVSEGQNRSELENTAAIRRKASGRMALDE